MIKGTRAEVLAALYKQTPAVIRTHGTAPEFFFTSLGTFEQQLDNQPGIGRVLFFHLDPKTSALSLEQEDFEITI